MKSAAPPAEARRAPHSQLSPLPPEPVIPSKKPYKAELVGGKRYTWCTGGQSKNRPFCDRVRTAIAIEKSATVWLCGCKHTNNPPCCDGPHSQDFIVSAPLHEPTNS